MNTKTTAVQREIEEIFKDLEQTLRNYSSDSISYREPSRDQEHPNSLGGSDLFLKFTADIIKEESVFTR